MPEGPATRGDVWFGVGVASANVLLFSVVTLGNWATWGGMQGLIDEGTAVSTLVAKGGWLFFVNVVQGFAVVALVFGSRPLDRSWPQRIVITVIVSTFISLPWVVWLQWDEASSTGPEYAVVQWTSGVVASACALWIALIFADTRRRARREGILRLSGDARTAQAIAHLETEEYRVRRQVSDQLHGTVQHRLVVATAGLDAMAGELEGMGRADLAERVQEIAEDLDDVREVEVRILSQALFPSGVEMGTIEAVQVMLDRLPRGIKATASLGPAIADIAERKLQLLTVPERLVIVYAIEEAVTNALKHGRARSVHIHAEMEPLPKRADGSPWWLITVTIDDDGVGPGDQAPQLSGLERHRARFEVRGGTLTLGTNPHGGGRLKFTFPFVQRW